MDGALPDFPWHWVAAGLGVVGAVLLIGSLVALFRARPVAFLLRLLGGALLTTLAALLATVTIGTAGYRALTHEVSAAHITVRPLGGKRFQATVQFPDGRVASYDLAGDEIYVDAHILKWRPIANIAGLHTAYELDRIAGRYQALSEEQNQPRTVHSLGTDKPIDMFHLRRRYTMLEPLLDAEYGSASFVPVNRPAEFDVRVSTTGVLIRERVK
jgi:hypothetical protein